MSTAPTKTYTVTAPNGKTFTVTAPAAATPEQVMAYARAQFKPEQQGAAPDAAPTQPQQSRDGQALVPQSSVERKDGGLDPDDLQYDKEWLNSSKIMWQTENSGEFKGSNKELADWGLNRMARFNYDMTLGTAVDAVRLRQANVQQKQAFLYMMETFDKTDYSWEGFGRAAYHTVTDLSNLPSLVSFGTTTVVKQGVQSAAKAGLKEFLRESVREGVKLGLQNAALDSLQNIARQDVEKTVGARTEYSALDTAEQAAISFGAGTVLGAGVTAASKGIKNFIGKNADDIAPKINEGADPSLHTGDAASDVAGKVDGQGITDTGRVVQSGDSTAVSATGMEETAVGSVPPLREAPTASVTSSTASTFIDTLPTNLAGAKPRFNFGKKGFGLEFESDIEKALYITSQTKKSKADDAYRQFLRDAGFDDAQIDTLGKQVREHIKGVAKDSTDEAISVGKIVERPGSAVKQGLPDADVVPTPRQDGMTIEAAGSADNVPPPAPNADIQASVDAIAAAVDAVADRSGQGLFYRTRETLGQASSAAVDLIKQLGIRDINDAANLLRNLSMTDFQRQVLFDAVKKASDYYSREVWPKAQKAFQAGEISEESLREIENVQHVVTELFKAQNTGSGLTLGNVSGSFAVGARRETSSVPSILAKSGKTLETATEGELRAAREELLRLTKDEQEAAIDDVIRNQFNKEPHLATDAERQAAEQMVEKAAIEAEENAKINTQVKKLDQDITEALDAGDYQKANDLTDEKEALEKMLISDEIAQTFGQKVAQWWDRSWDMINDYTISVLFTQKTITRNGLPGLTQIVFEPLMRAYVKGLDDYAARREMFASYYTFLSHGTFALRRAVMAFEFERNLQNMDHKIGDTAFGGIPGIAGRVIRFIPRVMQFTDQLVRDFHIAQRVEGLSVYNAIKKVQDKNPNISRDELNKIVKGLVEKSRASAYIMLDRRKILQVLREEGIRKGLTGDDLSRFVRIQAEKRGDLFKMPRNVEAIESAADATYTHELPKGLRWYEEFFNNHKWARLAFGQPFIRTPIWVANKILRVTPGIQNFHYGFMMDLAGKNGAEKQVRAQIEATLASIIAGHAVYKYAMGQAKPSGPSDYKQNRTWQDTEKVPSAFKTDEGWFSLRGLDPFAGVYKTLWNIMAGYDQLLYRTAQGEYVGKDEFDMALAKADVVRVALAQTIRDSNLWEGATEALDLLNAAFTGETDTGKMSDDVAQYFAKKIKMAVPNIWQTGVNFNNPEITAPATFWQFLNSALQGSEGAGVPKQYDPLGNVRTRPVSWWSFFGIDYFSDEQVAKNLTPQQKDILKKLQVIENATNTSFQAPYRMDSFLRGVDLRKRMSSDGRTTIYDKWMERYREMDPASQLLPLFEIGGVVGTPGANEKGKLVDAVSSRINNMRKVALEQVLREESGVLNESISIENNAAMSRTGEFDQNIVPFQ